MAVPLTAAAQVTAKFAVTLPEKSHQGQGVAKFIELVDAKSGGKIKIKGFMPVRWATTYRSPRRCRAAPSSSPCRRPRR